MPQSAAEYLSTTVAPLLKPILLKIAKERPPPADILDVMLRELDADSKLTSPTRAGKAEALNNIPLVGGAPVPGTKLFLRYDPTSPNAEWYQEKFASVEAWKNSDAAKAPMADVMQAFLPWESEFLQKTKGEMVVPFHAANMTEAILTEELRCFGTISESTSVSKITEMKALAGGTDDGRLGVLSCIFRIKAEYDGGTGPKSMIYKSSPLTEDFYPLRGLCKGMRAFEIEVKAYNTDFAYMQGARMPCPKGFFAAFDPEASRYQLLLEDLNTRSSTMVRFDSLD